ncbi:MAG: hypothetical protein GY895_22130, partial [Phycisphaera sp.]|nr:hypothetical protein [Phycisphaera sp.]
MTRTSSFFSRSSSRPRNADRGNTLVLVTVILVLLVIIAVAFISRTQGGRVIASAQRKAIDREDRSEVAVGVVSQAIAGGLFPALVDPSDPLVQRGDAASSGTPRLRLDEGVTFESGFQITQPIERFDVDPTGYDSAIGPASLLAPYNFAPYETVAWTNWPDIPSGGANQFPFGPGNLGGVAIGDSNPFGNPGFGDTRWLRSSEPVRTYNADGPVQFSHWTHLSWIPSAENGIRVCKDITNIAPIEDGGGTIVTTYADILRSGANQPYEALTVPVALQTPYEQWLPEVYPFPVTGATSPFRFTDARDQWFGPPSVYANAMLNGGLDLLPNFIHLESLGPKSDEASAIPNEGLEGVAPPIRKVVASTLADADGDGFTDSFWFVLPGASEDGVRQVAAVSIIDNASMVDVNVATRFDRWSTAGHTPADVALTSRLRFNPYVDGDLGFDSTDTLTGLLSDPQNSGMHGGEYPGFGPFFAASAEQDAGDGPETPVGNLDIAFWPPRFDGASPSAATEPGWTEEMGVTFDGSYVLPYRTPFLDPLDDPEGVRVAELDRRRYFQRRLFDGGPALDRYDADGDPILPVDSDLWGIINAPTRAFGNADELELRMFAGNGYGPVISRLERTIERPWGIGNNNDRYRYNPLRSTLTRAENVARPLGQSARGGHQLDARELMFDTRHRMTTYSATRNDLVPLYQRPTPLYVPGWQDPWAPAINPSDYAFGRIRNRFTPIEVVRAEAGEWGGFESPAVGERLRDFSRASYEERGRKLDLRASLDGPFTKYEALLYSPNPADSDFQLFPHRIFDPIGRLRSVDPNLVFLSDVREGLWPGQADINDSSRLTTEFKNAVAIDREIRFRQRLESVLADGLASAFPSLDGSGGTEYQSYLQDQYRTGLDPNGEQDLIEYGRSRDLAASWAANIDGYRDARRRVRIPVPNFNFDPVEFEDIYLDQPIWWQDAPIVPSIGDPNTRFVGMEPQPFLMEAFFATVYPASFADDEMRDGLPESEGG